MRHTEYANLTTEELLRTVEPRRAEDPLLEELAQRLEQARSPGRLWDTQDWEDHRAALKEAGARQ